MRLFDPVLVGNLGLCLEKCKMEHECAIHPCVFSRIERLSETEHCERGLEASEMEAFLHS